MEKVHRPRLSGRSRVVVVCAHLLDAIEAGSVPRSDLSAFTVGQLARSNDKQVLDKLEVCAHHNHT